MRLLLVGLLTLVASTSSSAPALDGEMPVPASFKPEFVLSYSYCNLGSDYHRGEGSIVFECRVDTSSSTCSVRNAASSAELLRSTATPKRAIKFSVSIKGTSTFLTSPKQAIKIEIKDDKSSELDHEPWNMYSRCEYGGYKTIGAWRKLQEQSRADAVEEANQPDAPQQSSSSPSSSSSRPAAAEKKGKGLGEMCKATSECEAKRVCKLQSKTRSTCQ